MKSEFFLLANGSSIDIHSNTLSIFEIVDELAVNLVNVGPPENPVLNQLFPLQLICGLERENSDPQNQPINTNVNVRIVKDTVTIIDSPVPVNFDAHHKRYRLRLNINVPLAQGGLFQFSLVSQTGTIIATKELNVVPAPAN